MVNTEGNHEEANSDGFSLVELIVVVVILGVLAAIAIPIFNGIENVSRSNATKAIAAEAATGATAEIASDRVPAAPLVDQGFTATWKNGSTPTTVEEVCVVATRTDTGETAAAGPGC